MTANNAPPTCFGPVYARSEAAPEARGTDHLFPFSALFRLTYTKFGALGSVNMASSLIRAEETSTSEATAPPEGPLSAPKEGQGTSPCYHLR